MKNLFALVMIVILAMPYIAWAAPLTGANSDVGVYYHSDGFGTFTEDVVDANDSGVDGDVSWVIAGSEHAYIGYETDFFNAVYFDISTVSPLAEGYDLNVEYFNGEMWTLLTTVPGNENPFQFTGTQSFSFTIPNDWAMTVPEGSSGLTSAFYIRIGDGSQGAEIDQISLFTVNGGGGGGEGGGGASVPEFSTYMYIFLLAASGIYIYYKTESQKQGI